ncbi:MAG: hypothetical protein JW723_15490 [Bacteroidales bacterium]|nr:hypothetical protein [Bacteroidales bacterium]
MDSERNINKFHVIEIPKVFKTFISEEYFRNCITCDKYLLDDETEYVIEKVIRDGYVELEYSMCMDCVEKMRLKMSKESMERVNQYFEKNFNFYDRRYDLLSSQSSDIDDYISSCLFKNKSIHELEEYQLLGHCRGDKMLLSVFPYMVSKDAIEEVQELLSAKTREELDDFTDKHFGLPPDLKEIIRSKRPVFL